MQQQLERIGRFRWRLPATGAMRVDGLIYASEDLASEGGIDEPARQVANVATLPGIVGHAIAMPDIHWGYGFPIGGVAAFDLDEGVVSPGGVGYDINCGVRMLATILDAEEISSRVPDLAEALYRRVPAGLGSARRDLKLSEKELERVLTEGARWASARGFGVGDDLERLEEGARRANTAYGGQAHRQAAGVRQGLALVDADTVAGIQGARGALDHLHRLLESGGHLGVLLRSEAAGIEGLSLALIDEVVVLLEGLSERLGRLGQALDRFAREFA